MKNKNLILTALALLLIIGGVYWLMQKEGKTVQEEQTEVIKIGVLLPFSGDLSSYGGPMKEGISIFKQQNPDVKIIFEDSKGKQKDVVNGLRKVITLDKVKYVIGDVVSQNTLSMIPIVEKNNIFLLSPGASSPKLNGISKFFARNYPSSVDESIQSAKFAYKNGKHKGVVVYVNSEFGLGLEKYFKSEFIKLGGGIIKSIAYNEGNQDFKNILASLKGIEYDVLYLAGNQLEMGNFIKQFRQYFGFKKMVISNISFLEKSTLQIAGKYAKGVIVPTAKYNDNFTEFSSPNQKEFVRLFKIKYDRHPTIVNSVGYDAISIIYDAINEVGNDPIKVSNYIRNLKNYQGAMGKLNFDNGDVSFPVQFNEVLSNGSINKIN